MRIFLVFLMGIVLIGGCKKKEAPKPPSSALLVHPEENSECTTGVDLGGTTSEVQFRWQAATNTDTYELRVTDNSANTVQTITTAALFAKLPLEKGGLYSWSVTTRNAAIQEAASSPVWQFYNSGFQITYAPFPAEIIAPLSGQTVFKDINNDVILDWSGTDIENDITGYDIYFSTENPPETRIDSPDSFNTSKKVSVVSGGVYYWKVITKDQEGNTSDSGIYEFRVQ